LTPVDTCSPVGSESECWTIYFDLIASKASKGIIKLGMEFEQENYGDESTLVAPSDGTIFADFFNMRATSWHLIVRATPVHPLLATDTC
jgi:hypothetical protein